MNGRNGPLQRYFSRAELLTHWRHELGLRATDVFVPGAFPEHTYVERTGEKLEQSLRDALDTPGQVVSLSGPSKSGKTVLVERVVGRDFLIPTSGAGIRDPEAVWARVLDWMNAPHTTTQSRSTGTSKGSEVSASGSVSLPLVASGESEVTGSLASSSTTEQSQGQDRRGLTQVVKDIARSDYVILVDDFHYMARDVQLEVVKALKEAARLGVKVVTAAVRHRGDDVVRALPELRGRVRAVDLDYWSADELRRIPELGLQKLDIELPGKVVNTFVEESAGSPQLMQLMCLCAAPSFCLMYTGCNHLAPASRYDAQ
jgi:hypothetical protein